MDDNEKALYEQLEDLRFEYTNDVDSLSEQIAVYETEAEYRDYIIAKYPAVAEAYNNFLTLFNLAQETEMTPDVAKAA